MARRADQELNDQGSSTSWNYKPNIMDAVSRYWPILLLVAVLLIIWWKYGLKKL